MMTDADISRIEHQKNEIKKSLNNGYISTSDTYSLVESVETLLEANKQLRKDLDRATGKFIYEGML